MSEQPTPARPGFREIGRALARQLWAAVYVYILYAVAARYIGAQSWTFIVEPALIFAGGWIAARLIEGAWWTSSFVGCLVAGLDMLLSWGLRAGDESLAAVFAINTVVFSLAGFAGAWLARRRLSNTSGRAKDKPTEEAS